MRSIILNLTYNLLRGSNLARRFAEAACDANKTGVHEYLVLTAAAQRGAEGIGMAELLTLTGISRARIRTILDGMVEAQLIRREAHAEDKRAVTIQLRSRGRALMEEVDRDLELRMKVVLGSLSYDEMGELNKRLQNLVLLDELTRSGLMGG